MRMLKTLQYKQYILRAYWSNRLKNAQECAIELTSFLGSLEELGPPFITWDYFNTKDKIERIPTDINGVRNQLLLPGNGAKRGVKPDEVMSAMGFNTLLFSAGKNSERITLSMNCGVQEVWPSNRCCIDLPSQGEIATQILQPEPLKSLLEIVVKAWNPDWAVIDYFDHDDPDMRMDHIPVYWFVYLSEQRGQIPTVPSPSYVGHIEGHGNYVMITPEPFTRERPDHLEAANQVKAILGQAGLLTSRPN